MTFTVEPLRRITVDYKGNRAERILFGRWMLDNDVLPVTGGNYRDQDGCVHYFTPEDGKRVEAYLRDRKATMIP